MTEAFNLFALWRLYNPNKAGRGDKGNVTRLSLYVTVTEATYQALAK